MPIDSYDPWFGSKKGSANKALAALVKQYGLRKGTEVFYALANKRKRAGRRFKRAADNG